MVRLRPRRLGKPVKLPVYLSPSVKKVLTASMTRVTGYVKVSRSQAKYFKDVNIRYNRAGYPIISSKRLPRGLGKTTAGVHEVAYFLSKGKKRRGLQVDHINADRSDARIGNLQAITREQNIAKIPRVHRQAGFRKRNFIIRQKTGLTLSEYRAKTLGFEGLSRIAKKIARNLGREGLSAKAKKAAQTKGKTGLSVAAKKGAKTLGRAGILARNKKISEALKGHKNTYFGKKKKR